MSLTRRDVEKVSLLARLRLSEAELATMTPQLDKIVHFIEQLNELDTSAVQPMAHALDMHNVFAADEVHTSLERAAALSNAPKHDDECYRVPAVLGD
ncbi:MAG TPA: Asp-tRNA(Asn)/Glu-tRNA(Gln) amidotransferase subunit GatC [Pirellulaceae bacterium]|nr:Asp-tRNA(Asn)/Glu-tRNA(Gln) amidotransferase subunit GatC [Pirellulaceae bacterium]